MKIGSVLDFFARKTLLRLSFTLAVLSALYCFFLFFLSGSQFLIAALTLGSSYLLSLRLFGGTDLIDRLNSTFLILCSQVILITGALSLCGAISGSNYLIAAAALFLTSTLVSKNIREPFAHDLRTAGLSVKMLYAQMKGNKLASLFLSALLLSFAWRMLLIVSIPPNNWDGLTYHLSRAAYWLQNGSLRQFYTPFPPQAYLPFNAEIMLLWTMAASRLDRFCGFIQFACYLLSGTLVYACCRRYLKAGSMPALLAALFWYSLPEAVLESTSVQNDLVVAYFIMFCLTYFLLGTEGSRRYLVLSAAALALAFGTKLTAMYFALPFSALLLFLVFIRKLSLKNTFIWSTAFAAAFALLSSYNFIQNYLGLRNFFGPEWFIAFHKVAFPSLRSFSSNLFQHLFNISSSQPGLELYAKNFSAYYNVFISAAGELFSRILHIPIKFPGSFRNGKFSFDSPDKFILHEDFAFFGVAGAVMLLLAAYVFITQIRRRHRENIPYGRRYLIFAFLSAGFLSALSFLMKWDPWQGRYLTSAALIASVLLAILFRGNRGIARRIGEALIIYSIVFLPSATLMNERKPMDRLSEDRIALTCLTRPQMEPVLRKFNSSVPLKARVGIVLPQDSYDFPLFGERLGRTIIQLNAETVKKQRFDFLAVVDTEMEGDPELEKAVKGSYRLAEVLGQVESKEWVLYVPAS